MEVLNGMDSSTNTKKEEDGTSAQELELSIQ